MGCITGGLIGSVLTACSKAILWVVNFVINIVAKVIWYLGFSVPFFYLIYGLFLWMFGFNVFDFTTYESRLYLIGLIASGICTVIILIRNVVGRPVRGLFHFTEYIKFKHDGREYTPEKPLVYRSKQRPDFIIYEYYDHYEIFTDRYGGTLTPVRTDKKTAKEIRASRKRK